MNDALFERLIAGYARAIRVLDPIRFSLWSDRGLTMPQIRVLFLLSELGERSAGDLAEELGVAPSTVTGITDRLCRQGLIERLEDPADRRVVLLGLTREGRALTTEVADASRYYLRRVLERLPGDRLEALARSLEEFADAYAVVAGEGQEAAAWRS